MEVLWVIADIGLAYLIFRQVRIMNNVNILLSKSLHDDDFYMRRWMPFAFILALTLDFKVSVSLGPELYTLFNMISNAG